MKVEYVFWREDYVRNITRAKSTMSAHDAGWEVALGTSAEESPGFSTMAEAIAAIKATDNGANGRWKWYRQSPGDGVTRAVFVCNNHTDCAKGLGRMMKAVQQGAVFILQVKGEHGDEPTPGKRKNSVCTWAQAEAAGYMLEAGIKAGAMHTSMVTKEAKVLEAAGKDPIEEKNAGGGLPGEIRQPPGILMCILMCILDASVQYSTRTVFLLVF